MAQHVLADVLDAFPNSSFTLIARPPSPPDAPAAAVRRFRSAEAGKPRGWMRAHFKRGRIIELWAATAAFGGAVRLQHSCGMHAIVGDAS
jgi:hypothetical protein